MLGIELIIGFVIFIYSVILHEISHGLMAKSLGDNTAEDLGRLTLNPIKHLDMFGSILMPLFLVLVGSPFIFGYAKPVPYNPLRLRDQKYGSAKVALAGPLSNIFLAILCGMVLRFLPDALGHSLFQTLLQNAVFINILLALFNLMPVPPLDGHWLLLTFLPNRFHAFKIFVVRYGIFIFIFFLFFIFPLLYPLINFFFKLIVGK